MMRYSKQIVRFGCLVVALAWWLGTAGGRRGRRRPVVLCYHGVRPDQRIAFERQMRRLVGRVVGLEQVVHSSCHRRAVAITFDDAFDNLRTSAVPLLRHLEIPATIFAVADRLGGVPDWAMRPEHPDRHERIMSRDALRALAREEWCSIGSHSLTHRAFTTLDPAAARHELDVSRDRLEALTGQPVTMFAFPYGACDAHLCQLARAAGYQVAAVLDHPAPSRSDLAGVVPRTLMSPDTSWLEFRLAVDGAYTWKPYVRRWIARFRRPGGPVPAASANGTGSRRSHGCPSPSPGVTT